MGKNKRPKQDIYLEKKDCEILEFLWKWKIASTQVLKLAISPETGDWGFYQRIRKLEKEDFIVPRAGGMEDKFYSYELTQRGFDYIHEELGELEDVSFRSTCPVHDTFIGAFQNGPLLNYENGKSHSDVFVTTETHLKTLPIDRLNNFVPTTRVHRPDGYTVVINKAKEPTVVAIEVELNTKSMVRYLGILDFYESMMFERRDQKIDFILWLVPNKTLIDNLMAICDKRRLKSKNLHQFVFKKDFLYDGWNAQITHGRFEGDTIAQFYTNLGVKLWGNPESIPTLGQPRMTYLNINKSPVGMKV